MRQIAKVSEVTYEDVADYLRLGDLTYDEINTLNTLITISKSFISQYTGRNEEDIDRFPDFVIVLLILCQDMWDNRALYVDKTNLNHVVETILGLHSVNLL